MGKQTIRIHRIGSVTFGIVLVITGVIFLLQQFLPRVDYVIILRFWPIILIGLGIEVLLGNRRKNLEVLDEEGKIVEQNKVVYDVPAIVLTVVLIFFSVFLAMVNWALIHSQGYYFNW